MKINKNSWHYKYLWNTTNRPDNLCQYFWTCFIGGLLYNVMLGFVGMTVIKAPYLAGELFITSNVLATWFTGAVASILLVAAMGAIVWALFNSVILLHKLWKKVIGKFNISICPDVEVVDE